MEIELKLLLKPDDTDRFRQLALVRQYAEAAPREQHLADTYYDTPHHDFKKQGAGLRVRACGGEAVQTLKGGGDASGGLHRRSEWETPAPGGEPDLDALCKLVRRKDACGELLRDAAARRSLAPVFRTRVTRTVWDLALPGGGRVEMALDLGRLECGDDAVPVSEIELELKAGNALHLFDFALALLHELPLQIGSASKAERGYALCRPQSQVAAKARPVALSRKDTVEKAFRAIAVNCLAQVHANAAGVAAHYDDEHLHQMRVGLRRLDSALRLFGKALSLPVDIASELAWLDVELGNARDWDVLAASTLPSLAADMPAGRALLDVTHATEGARRDARAAASNVVASTRYTRLMLSLGRWLFAKGWRQRGAGGARRLDADATGFARTALRRAHRRLQKRGKALQDIDPAERHRARIAAKKMRYATEFFASLYPARRVRPLVKALSKLQDELGHLNDAAAGRRLLAQLELARPDMAAPIGSVRAVLDARAGDTDKAGKEWKRYKDARLPR